MISLFLDMKQKPDQLFYCHTVRFAIYRPKPVVTSASTHGIGCESRGMDRLNTGGTAASL